MPPLHPLAVTLALALLLGIVAGMRSLLPLAALGVALWRHPTLVPAAVPASWFAHGWLAVLLVVLALGELVVDKLPRTPNRTALAPFLGRLITGGLSGGVVAQTARHPGWIGAVAGVIGAALGAIVMFHARQRVDRALGVPDPWVGAGEDVLALVLAGIAVTVLLGG